MNTNSVQENRKKIIAITISVTTFSLLVLFFMLYSFISPKLLSPQLSNIQIADLGNNSLEIGFSKEEAAIKENSQNLQHTKNNEAKNQLIASNENTTSESLREKFFENKGKNSDVINEHENTDQENLNGSNKTNEPGDYNSNSISNVSGINLTGRTVNIHPTILKDTKEEGKVVVEITVDKAGKVIMANPNGRGTTTSSASLKTKAQKAAMATIFNTSKIEEQKGTITVIFSF